MAKHKKVYICYAPGGSMLWTETGSAETAARAGIHPTSLFVHLKDGSADHLGRTYDTELIEIEDEI